MKKELPFFVLFSFLLFFYACSHEHEQKVTHLSELESSQFAVVTGTIADQLVWSKFPNAECAYYNSPLEACIAVQQGIEVAAAYDEPILRNITAQNPGLKILPDMVTVDNYGMAVRKSDTHLKYAADSLLEAMKKDGRYDDMKNRWFPAQGKPAKMPVMEWEAPNGVLHFGTNAVTEPFSFVDDTQQIVGFDIEFVSLLAQSLGMKLEIHNMEFGS
ncbi:MAG: transporter substrate-binding domain-containing protein, partial [Proteiniphilum sp.]|nr:transporter substrate-binding domain-containing protein [Proteiniphilum sp.]